MKFKKEEHKIWKTLFERQLTKVKNFACKEYLTGFDKLKLSRERIPTIIEINREITGRTGWKVERTKVRYSDSVPWYFKFANKVFMITNYVRSWKELDFTPEPDLFHDVFGHLPFMTLKHYTELQEMFAPAFLRANKEEQDNIKRLAWFTTEFGLIKENNEVKIFGAGLISSSGEMENVLSGKVPIRKFKIENVLKRDKAIWSFNKELFIFNSIDELKKELKRYFDPIASRNESSFQKAKEIVDRELVT